ncbi:MAG: type II toxin-antitoxin system HicB family antitoxin [Gammaproteobacteria bacterium]|nr:type II toxin-antitoxin system HicB family antitoxin [Gammaproteobacteria bacterium]
MQYMVVIERSETGYGAYVPDLPGCVAAAASRDETLRLIKEAIEFHIEGLREAGEPVPEPASIGELVEVNAA